MPEKRSVSARTLAAVLPLILLCTSGCLFFHGYSRGRPVDEEALRQLAPGDTNTFMAESSLGLPEDIVVFNSGMIYRYEFTKINTLVLLLLARTDEQTDRVDLVFDDRGIMVDKKAQYLSREAAWRFWPFGR